MSKQAVTTELKPFLAELLGTTVLALTVGVGLVGVVAYPEYQSLYLPAAIGGILALLVYVFASVSGSHFNPAVSFGLFVTKKIDLKRLLLYWIAQIVGAFLGFQLAKLLMGSSPQAPEAVSVAAYAGEFLGTFLLALTVTAVVLGKIPQLVSGVAIGLALTIGISLAMYASGGVLNPALALALGSYQLSYLLMPLLGAAVGAGLAIWLLQE